MDPSALSRALAAINHLSGDLLTGVLAALMFIEEAGVPLPFAPGDVMLVIGGIAIATGSVEPQVLLPALILSTIAGAMTGREIFSLIGRPALERAARALGFQKPLERATSLMRRGGARTVLVGRLIPGLRIHTTQVAGVTNVPRLTFLAGLVPAVLIYIGVFVALGALVGQPVVSLLHRAEHRLFSLAASAVLALAFIISVRWLIRRGKLDSVEPILVSMRRELADSLERYVPGNSRSTSPEFPLVRRVWAAVTDALLILGISVFLVSAAAGPAQAEVVFDPPGLGILAAIAMIYRIPLEALWGQTMGKRVMGIAVLGTEEGPPGWLRSAVRNLLVLVLPLWPADTVLMLRNPGRTRVGDLLAGTRVRRVSS